MKPIGTLFVVAGLALLAIGIIWASVVGYYPSEVPALLATLGGGALMVFIGSRMVASTKPTSVTWSPTTTPPPPAQPAPPAVVATPVTATTPAATPVAGPETAEIDDATVAVPRRRHRVSWSVSLPDGASFLVREQVLLGRAPQATAEHPRAELVVIDDPSVSKSHAMLQLAGGALQVLDRGSANGTVMIIDDVEQDCPPGVWMLVPDGATLELGTVELRCTAIATREVAS